MKKLLFIGICVLVLGACNPNNDDSKDQSLANGPDSATATTTDTSGYDAALALLNDISVDRATFKQLYTNCRVKGDEFNGKFLYPQTAPTTPNSNALFAYINETTPGIRLVIQYYAPQKLGIKTVTFTIDGETHDYQPPFKSDAGNGHYWEWSDELVTNAQLPLLIKLATSVQPEVKFTGTEGQQFISVIIGSLTPQQQQSLKNMLMLYKGILMGYNA
ncbi:hypothetical protein [Mucilaginibacter puniceus]